MTIVYVVVAVYNGVFNDVWVFEHRADAKELMRKLKAEDGYDPEKLQLVDHISSVL